MKKYYKRNEILKIISDCVYKSINEYVDVSYNLVEVLDSLDAIEFIMELEVKFDISVGDTEFDNFFSSKKVITILDVFDFLCTFGIYPISELRKEKLKEICLK